MAVKNGKKAKPPKIVKAGDPVDDSRIYKCTVCGNAQAIMADETAPICDVCGTVGKKTWKPTRIELLARTRDVKKEYNKKRSLTDRGADAITAFCGNMYFVYVHLIWFAVWLMLNEMPAYAFDPYPYGFLTLIVSLEAILLATFILISQNRQADIAEVRSELDYHTNIVAEKRTAEILTLLRELHKKQIKK